MAMNVKLRNEFVDVPIEKIKQYENNPRINEQAIPAVAQSIKHYGFNVPVIIDNNNIIVAGHTRLEAAKSLGMKKIPCIKICDLSEEKIKAFRLIDNKVAELSYWDFEKLSNELEELKEVIPESDLNLFKFNEMLLDQFQFDDIATEKKIDKKSIICPRCGYEQEETQ